MIIKAPGPEHIPALRALWQEAFGDTDAFLDGFFRTGFSFDRCRCVLDGGSPVAVLYWFNCTWQDRKLAYIYAVATAESHRGQGLCRSLMTDTHIHLQALGYTGAVLVPGSKELFRLYEKLDYIPFCPRQLAELPAAEKAIPVTPVTAEDYAATRKKMLPAGSIWQDATTLAFLGTFAGFYVGDGFAFCGAVEDDILYFQEFIGNMERADSIIAYFNCSGGKIPISGGAPYAMFYPLQPADGLPDYFGIPLN